MSDRPHQLNRLTNTVRDESGSSSVQHATLLALIVTVCLGGVQSFGTAVQNYFQKSHDELTVAGGDGSQLVTSERVRGRRIGQKVPAISLEERLRLAEERTAQRIAELRERAARRQH